jgi:predicted amidohydrolase YtcJ
MDASAGRRTAIRRVEVRGRTVDVLVASGRIIRIGTVPTGDADEEVSGDGGALIPGLHDHHIHLLAAAAARTSVDLAASETTAEDELRRADRALPPGAWLRVVGYHESMMGTLDRTTLDALLPDRPTRVQHRTGSLWVLNTAALAVLGDALRGAPDGVELDPHGNPTGRLWRVDTWLRSKLPPTPPDVLGLARELRTVGLTGVTDMTPYDTLDDARPLFDEWWPLRLVLSGSPALADAPFPRHVQVGPVKIVIDEHDPPPYAELTEWVRHAHRSGRNVAVHCVTRAALALMVAAWDDVGARPGDRVEHGAVVPPELAGRLSELRITVVTQPSFVRCRGDQYIEDVEPDDLPHLWPCKSLLDAGVPVGAGSDAPYGPSDPWSAVASASARVTTTGRSLGPAEAVTHRRALEMFLSAPHDPGGPPRRVEVGAPADLCLLDRPLLDALVRPSAAHVRQTWVAGV